MKNQGRFPACRLLATTLVTALVFGVATLAAAQNNSAASGAHARYQQEAISPTRPAVIFTTLVNFDGTDGANPGLSPIQGKDGNLYGGTGGGGDYGHGLLYRMTMGGSLTPLYSFCAQSGCPDGVGGAPEVLGSDGNFYGSTGGGGPSNDGTLFKFTKAGTLTTLHDFEGTDGLAIKHLVEGSDGNFYGTTSNGGNLSECAGNGCGTVFKMTPRGVLTTLYNFCSQSGCADGAVLYDALKQGTDGNYYGTTWAGGLWNGGTIFRITPKGTPTTVYSFCVKNYPFCSDGSNPIALVLGTDGNFYGTTADGGAYGEGSVFKITRHGKLTTIYSFCVQIGCTDGAEPHDGLALGSDGNFYGPTFRGGMNNEGTLFQITPAGALTTLHSFDGTDGYYPVQHLFQATNGIFYGVTDNDGSSGDGTIFSLDLGLLPFVETAPISGKVGSKVIILGSELKGTTSVTFNGASAAVFHVVSSTEITTTVPNGAITGKVQVTTPGGTLTSNVNFLVVH
jgi:uncharacterized repeat protein (TIGR03803 family)